jgi:hypothetical protein
MRSKGFVAGAVSAGLAALLASGCANALRDRTMTVIFRDTASQAQLESASAACAHAVPGITALPVAKPPSGTGGGGRAGAGGTIQFRIGGADDHDVAQLTDCLDEQPGVLAVQPPNDDMT